MAHERIPEEMLAALNGLFNVGKFPDVWKEGRVVLIPKAGKDPALSSSYRPICLLNTFGKLYERLLVNRLNAELEEGEIISSRQHGFRRKRSTVSALMDLRKIYQENERRWCIVITLDIRNAFNSAGWRDIINEQAEQLKYVIIGKDAVRECPRVL